jgi:hypothetical protein
MSKDLTSYSNRSALRLSGRQVAARGCQAARCRMVATQTQPEGRGLFARHATSSLSCALTYTPSFFLALGASSFRRGAFGV